MKTVWNTVQFSFAAVGGFLGWFLGGCDGLLYALIAFVTVDYVTGVMCAVVDRKLSSSAGFKGIFRKVLIFVMVGISHMFSRTARKSKLRSEAVNAKYSKAVEEFDFFHRLVGVLLIYCP